MKGGLSRLFVEKRQVAWVALIATLLWGVVAYRRLPERKDPEVTIKTAVITAAWPGARAADVEELVTIAVEQTARQVARVDTVTSTTRPGVATVYVTLEDGAKRADVDVAWNDLRARVDVLAKSLPRGVAPPVVNTRFGDTATVVYSIASPAVDDVELDVRAAAIRRALDAPFRATPGLSATLFLPPTGISHASVAGAVERYARQGSVRGALRDARVVWGTSFVAVTHLAPDAAALARLVQAFLVEELGGESPHPDAWPPLVVRSLDDVRPALAGVRHEKYGYRRLDDLTRSFRDAIARMPEVSRVDRHGVVPETLLLAYSQERLTAFGVQPDRIAAALAARGSGLAGGAIGTGLQRVVVDPESSLASVDELLSTVVATTKDGRPIELRDVAEVRRTYEAPVSDASYLHVRHGDAFRRTRAIAVAVELRSGVQVTKVGEKLDEVVAGLRASLPPDLVITKTSDQPELVRDKIGDFLRALFEAVAIVVAVALLFMERRSALLVAASIPLTLAMTFGLMDLFHLDLQQVSIAALIISLGLLVDDPVIVSDAINRELSHGTPRERAAWIGPVKLAKAVLYATLTNSVAFAPLLLVEGSMGEFIYSLPMVVVLALVSSRVVSMTFMPLLGYYLLRGQQGYEAALEGDGKAARLARGYNRLTEWVLDHKLASGLGFLVFLALGLAPARLVRTQFFPDEALARFYVHVRLPEGADVRATEKVAAAAEQALLGAEGERIEQIASFVGNGGPRWWSNVSPEPKNPAYALLLVTARRAEDTMTMVGRAQRLLRAKVPGARCEVYRVSSGKPAVTPVEVRVSGPAVAPLRAQADRVARILRDAPETADVADDWGSDVPEVSLRLDEAHAAEARVTHADVARASSTALDGARLATMRDGDRLIDVSLRLRAPERGRVSELANLYVWSGATGRAVPLRQVATLGAGFEPPKIVRRGLERTITLGAIPRDGALASALLASAQPRLDALALPPGYHLSLGGEAELQSRSFATVSVALEVSVALIFLTLVWQFASVFKPLIVFAAIPFGLVGVVLGLTLTGTNFGFMAFLGVASLIGVIVSHIIVLFDFIEEGREKGMPLHRAVIDAGLVRLRPVLVTVLATVGGLVPLAFEGGPMWRQMVYVQMGGLLLATVVTKGVVPLLYVVFVETLGVVEWKPEGEGADAEESAGAASSTAL